MSHRWPTNRVELRRVELNRVLLSFIDSGPGQKPWPGPVLRPELGRREHFCVFAPSTRRHFADAMSEDSNDATCHGHKVHVFESVKPWQKIKKAHSQLPQSPIP